MTELTPPAQDALKAYLERVRASLRGTSVDADEVERDVQEHIDVALNGRSEPVSAADTGVLRPSRATSMCSRTSRSTSSASTAVPRSESLTRSR